jgi:hypothetical protein
MNGDLSMKTIKIRFYAMVTSLIAALILLPTAPALAVDTLADFEGPATPSEFFIFSGASTVYAGAINVADTELLARSGQVGDNGVLVVDFNVSDFGGFGQAFVAAGPQDWSSYTSFDFWFYGTGSGFTYQAEISDNRSNPGIDTSERFDYEFTDTTPGWQYISIPFEDFTRATDFQPVGAPDDGFTLTEIWAWAIVLPLDTDLVYFDDFGLAKSRQERLWASGTRPNGSYYEVYLLDFVHEDLPWSAARESAASKNGVSGQVGYLATIADEDENEFVDDLRQVAFQNATAAGGGSYPDVPQVWLGGYQPNPDDPPADGWAWVTGEPWAYTNWEPSLEPNDAGGSESHLAIGRFFANGDGEWNDEGATPGSVHGYVVEYEPVDVGEQVSIDDIPTPTGDDVPVVNLPNVFEQTAAQVVVAGTTDVDICVAPDIRERAARGRGRGQQSGYVPRHLRVSDLSGLGSCGDLSAVDLVIPSWYRGYPGKFPMDETGQDGVWLVIAVIKTTAEFDGPVVVTPFAESLVDYAGVVNPADACGTDLEWRPLSLGGAVEAFGDFPNVEGNVMIKETAQCNRSVSMTRRTTHVYPVRADRTPADERVNIGRQITGLSRTLNETAQCISTPEAANGVSLMQSGLNTARRAILRRSYEDAVEALEQIARDAKFNADDFAGCPIEANYKGNVMSRALSASFSVFDRRLHPDPNEWEIYLIPDDLDVPILKSDFVPPPVP